MVAPSKPALPNDNVAHALAGAGGGILSMILTYPLITLSTRAQVESSQSSSTLLKTINSIVAREGVSGLYSGLSSALLGISVTNFVYYYWFEWTRAFFERAKSGPHKKLSTWESMMAGALAGSATVFITNPIWVVNTRVTTRRTANLGTSGAASSISLGGGPGGKSEAMRKDLEAGASSVPGAAPGRYPSSSSPFSRQHGGPRGTFDTLMHLLREEGPAALFAGVLPALVLVVNPILQYTLFEQLKNIYEARRKQDITPAVAFVLGALGKLFATCITYPYITVKSRMHVGQGQKEGMVAALQRMVKEEGYKGLYNGISTKAVQSVLTAAFLFAFKDMLYEHGLRLRMAAARKTLRE